MQRTEHPLLSPSLGSQKTLVAFHFGTPGARPKVYIQASLHAEELPGMLVAHHLRQRLEAADNAGLLRGEVVLVPAANPIGLSQRLDHRAMGRFEFDTAQNFNRHYPDMAAAVLDDALTRLGPDAQSNLTAVRQLVGGWLTQWQPASELDSLRRRLLLLSHDADLVLDLHCDNDAVLHLYSEEACWPPLEPLARLLGCQAVLLARESGGGPFDERLSGLCATVSRTAGRRREHSPAPRLRQRHGGTARRGRRVARPRAQGRPRDRCVSRACGRPVRCCTRSAAAHGLQTHTVGRLADTSLTGSRGAGVSGQAGHPSECGRRGG